jgi:hypothetical protein
MFDHVVEEHLVISACWRDGGRGLTCYIIIVNNL